MYYVHAFQVKKLIKEKKDDPGISEYIDMEKELQEVSSFLILSCNVMPSCLCSYTSDTSN